MTKISQQDSQLAFHVIGQLASLVATPNISAVNVELANEEINKLLSKIIKPAITDLTTKAAGLLV